MSVIVIVNNLPQGISVGILPALTYRQGCHRSYKCAVGYNRAAKTGICSGRHFIYIIAILAEILVFIIWISEIVGKQSAARLTDHTITQTCLVIPSATASELRFLPVERDDSAVGVIVHIEILWRSGIIDSDKRIDFRRITFARSV